jgi:cytochrome c oxidase assembly factor CtaG
MVAPVLLLLGQPVTLLLHASRNPLHTWVKRAVRSRVVSAVTFPLVGVVLYASTVIGTHLTGFMNLTLEHPLVHDLEHGGYLLAGYLFFLPLIGREPIRWRLSFTGQLALLLLAMPIDTFTGVVLLQTDRPLFPAYAGRRDWGPSLVEDLHAGGATMWIGGDAIMFAIVVGLFVAVLRGRRALDAGHWLESARRERFATLAGDDRNAGLAPEVVGHTSGTTAVREGDARQDVDTDESQLAAYNAYLERLNAAPGRPPGGAP